MEEQTEAPAGRGMSGQGPGDLYAFGDLCLLTLKEQHANYILNKMQMTCRLHRELASVLFESTAQALLGEPSQLSHGVTRGQVPYRINGTSMAHVCPRQTGLWTRGKELSAVPR